MCIKLAAVKDFITEQIVYLGPLYKELPPRLDIRVADE